MNKIDIERLKESILVIWIIFLPKAVEIIVEDREIIEPEFIRFRLDEEGLGPYAVDWCGGKLEINILLEKASLYRMVSNGYIGLKSRIISIKVKLVVKLNRFDRTAGLRCTETSPICLLAIPQSF